MIWMGSLEVDTGQSLGKGRQYNLDRFTGGGHWAVDKGGQYDLDGLTGGGHWAVDMQREKRAGHY